MNRLAWFRSAIVAATAFSGVAGADAWDPGDDTEGGATDLGELTASWTTHGPHDLDASGVDHDWFRFYLDAGDNLMIGTTRTYTGAVTYIGGILYYGNSFLERKYYNLDYGDFQINHVAQDSGTYYLDVAVDRSGGEAAVVIVRARRFTNSAPSVAPRPGFPASMKAYVNYTVTLGGAEADCAEGDWISYEIDNDGDNVADRTVGVYLTDGSRTVSHSLNAPGACSVRCRLVDSFGATSTAWSEAAPVTVTENPNHPSQDDAGSGQDAPNSLEAAAYTPIILDSGAYTGYMGPAFDHTDMYFLYVHAGDAIRLSMTASGGGAEMYLYRSDMSYVGKAVADPGTPAAIEWIADQSGLATLSVQPALANGERFYDLGVEGARSSYPRLVSSISNTAAVSGTVFELVVTITNTGQVAASSISATIWEEVVTIASGDFRLTVLGGPEPAPPPTLAPGESVTLAWTVSVQGEGEAIYTCRLGYSDAATGATSYSQSWKMVTMTELDLTVGVSYEMPMPMAMWRQGDTIPFYLSVNNSSLEDGVDVVLDASLIKGAEFVEQVGGPDAIAAIPAFHMSYYTAGVYRLVEQTGTALAFSVTLTATGRLSRTTRTYASTIVASVINPEGVPRISAQGPQGAVENSEFAVQVSVTNTGDLALTGLAVQFQSSGEGAVKCLGPCAMAVASLAPDVTVAVPWLFRGTRAGAVRIEWTVTAMGGHGLDVPPRSAAVDIVIAPAPEPEPDAVPVFDREAVAYPSPATGDVLNIGLNLAGDASEVEVRVFNTSMQPVWEGRWTDVSRREGVRLAIGGVRQWAPGVYYVKARARFAGGGTQDFGTFKAVVRR